MPSCQDVNPSHSSNSSPTMSTSTGVRGRAAVIASSEEILCVLEFFYHKQPSALIDWTIGQQAFNSCMLLVSDAIEHCRITDGALKVEQSLVIFKELGENNVHRLAQYATEKISSCLKTLYDIVAQSPHNKSEARSRQEKRTAIPGSRKSEATQALATVGNVMGHTGMQLLEDCGLQASVQEAFAPMNWNTAGLLTDHSNEHEIQRENTKIGEKNALKPGSHRQGTLNFEPTDAVQGLSRSVTQYAMTSNDDRMQPHDYTDPDSPRDLAELNEERPKMGTTNDPGRQSSRCHETIRQSDPKDLFQELNETQYSGPFEHINWTHKITPSQCEKKEPYAAPFVTVMASSYGTTASQRQNSCPAHLRTNTDYSFRPAYSSGSNVDSSTNAPAAHTPLHASVAAPPGPQANTGYEYFQASLSCPPRMGNHAVCTDSIGRNAPCSPISISSANPGVSLANNGMFHGNQGQFDYLH
ncbi:hypothetical protein ACJQWK_08967 [Exserohilum turcicum]